MIIATKIIKIMIIIIVMIIVITSYAHVSPRTLF